MKISTSFLVVAFTAIGKVVAHGHDRSMHPREIAVRQVRLLPHFMHIRTEDEHYS
jgi:hypothetical protein